MPFLQIFAEHGLRTKIIKKYQGLREISKDLRKEEILTLAFFRSSTYPDIFSRQRSVYNHIYTSRFYREVLK